MSDRPPRLGPHAAHEWAVEGAICVPCCPQRLGSAEGTGARLPDVPAVIGRVVNHADGPYLSTSMRSSVGHRRGSSCVACWVEAASPTGATAQPEDTLRERSEVLYRSAFEWLS